MVKIVLTLVMGFSNNGSISNGCNNSFNIMASSSSNAENEEAYLLSPNQCVCTTSTKFPPFTVALQGPPLDSRNIARDNRHFSIRDYVTSQQSTKLQGLHGRTSELRIAAYVFGLSVLMDCSNASEQQHDGFSSGNVNQSLTRLNHQLVSSPAILVSIGNVNQGHGSRSSSNQSDVNITDPRQIGQNFNQLPFVHVLTSLDTSDKRTIEPSFALAGPNRATVVYNVQNNNSEHDRMRMDIDNLSYEDLLALGENIGNASTILNEETIRNLLKHDKYHVNKYVGTPKNKKFVAFDEFGNRQELGKFDCCHNYHVACIEKWLMKKKLLSTV
ncbi:hypothetical protein M9H77_26051 [Catharanthus roseus]|uniref:Uncharacterized protein n=1 Tax=Catharanthus roseus TaxID=4058 RepID=A0ACC0AB84_CATRO|nr:hypothetical protein M9H77_26051 [Catharanthus roseus]